MITQEELDRILRLQSLVTRIMDGRSKPSEISGGQLTAGLLPTRPGGTTGSMEHNITAQQAFAGGLEYPGFQRNIQRLSIGQGGAPLGPDVVSLPKENQALLATQAGTAHYDDPGYLERVVRLIRAINEAKARRPRVGDDSPTTMWREL